MKEAEILANTFTEEEHSLERLYEWLQYNKHSWMLGGGMVWLPYSLVLKGITVIAALFTPFMLWHLYKAGWYKSIVLFSLFVLIPFACAQLFEADNFIFNYTLTVLPLLSFYLFMWVLSHLIGEYLEEVREQKKIRFEQQLRVAGYKE
ncbi:MAG: hypothetical protein R3224_03760 [Balneolaceae bacterium]|nr:hypothetical protein [Balneolaceae bacterium]